MISAGNESLGIADYGMEPVKQTGRGIVGLVFVRKIFQGRFDIGGDLHFEMAWFALAIQRQCNKNLRLFRTASPLFSLCRPAKVRIVEVYHAVKLMLLIPLAHSRADTLEHIPGSLISRPQLAGELDCGNPPFILAHQVKGQKPFRQRHMGFMQHCSCRHGDLMAALGH